MVLIQCLVPKITGDTQPVQGFQKVQTLVPAKFKLGDRLCDVQIPQQRLGGLQIRLANVGGPDIEPEHGGQC